MTWSSRLGRGSGRPPGD